jgi:hypothetical protein
MDIKINCSLNGKEIADYFISKLKENNIDASDTSNIKFLITKRDGTETAMEVDKVRMEFNK